MQSRRRQPAEHSPSGFTLLECLAYIAMSGMILNVLMSLFATSSRMTALNTIALDRGNGVAEIQRTFAETVRPAAQVIDKIGEYRSSDNIAILRLPQRDECPRYAVIGAIAGPHHFSRLEIIDRAGVLEALNFTTHRLALDTMRITEENGLLCLEFTIQKDVEERKHGSMLHRALASPRARIEIRGTAS